MFLMTESKEACLRAISKLHIRLSTEFACGPIAVQPANGHWIGWFSCKPSDNFHVFQDGFVIGKLNFSEESKSGVIQHDEYIPKSISSLLNSTRIIKANGGWLIEPNAITNIYVSGQAVSDMQLLLADANRLFPDPMHIAVLSAVGYLPGNLSLFKEVQKIPLLNGYDTQKRTFYSTAVFEYRPNNDAQMIERIVSIIPRDVPSDLGISGGYDSRFVLGCLLKSGVRPTLIHLDSEENAVIKGLAAIMELHLKLDVGTALLSPDVYTVCTDAQIYFRGGNYSRAQTLINKVGVYHSGLFADSIIKNAFKTAWKIPGPRSSIHAKLVNYALLSTTPTVLKSLCQPVEKADLHAFLLNALQFERQYAGFQTVKEWACWFYYMNRGLRWTQATMADLSYFTYPVFLLSDLKALSFGISSGAWTNFHNDRVRNLNHKLLPAVSVGYVDGKAVSYRFGAKQAIRKIEYEYFSRLQTRLEGQRNLRRKEKSADDILETIPNSNGTGFESLFSLPLKNILHGDFSYSEKRSAISLFYVLDYLDN